MAVLGRGHQHLLPLPGGVRRLAPVTRCRIRLGGRSRSRRHRHSKSGRAAAGRSLVLLIGILLVPTGLLVGYWVGHNDGSLSAQLVYGAISVPYDLCWLRLGVLLSPPHRGMASRPCWLLITGERPTEVDRTTSRSQSIVLSEEEPMPSQAVTGELADALHDAGPQPLARRPVTPVRSVRWARADTECTQAGRGRPGAAAVRGRGIFGWIADRPGHGRTMWISYADPEQGRGRSIGASIRFFDAGSRSGRRWHLRPAPGQHGDVGHGGAVADRIVLEGEDPDRSASAGRFNDIEQDCSPGGANN